MRRRRSVLALLVPIVAVTACGNGSAGDVHAMRSDESASSATGTTFPEPDPPSTDDEAPSASSPAEPFDPAPTETEPTASAPPADDLFGWSEIDDGIDQGSFAVPIDYDNPAAGSFTLYLIRHRATDLDARIGTLLVNPGGPGVGGSYLAEAADAIYGSSLLESFDIVAWDPRGTGLSEPAVDCVDEYDPFFAIDSSPDTPDEEDAIVAAAIEFGDDCVQRSGEFLPFVSTEDTARDMEAMRQALGEEKISYFGFSYGSELGVTWASLFPDTVRAMVIDGAADQTVGYLEQNLQQAAGFEATFNTFLAECAANPDCEFYNDGDPAAAYDALSEQADSAPVETLVGRPAVTQGVLVTAVSDAMYAQFLWSDLEHALADLQNGDGEGILSLYDDYYSRQFDGSYDNSLEAYFAINCLDDPGTKDVDALFDMQDDFAAVAPRLGAGWILELQFCASWPVPAAPPVAVDAAGAGPVVVVGTTGDPATPLEGTRNMANALEDGRLIVVTADQHTGYGLNDCVNSAVDDYLVELQVPVDELICE